MTRIDPTIENEHWYDRLAHRHWLLVGGAMALLLLLISPNWKFDQDSASYLSMARSLAAGHGLLHLGLHQWYYAPFYSVVISPAFLFSGSPFLRIDLINILTAATIIVGTYVWMRQYSPQGAGLVAALVGINIGLWDVCREPRADTLFSALLIWSAIFFMRAANAEALKNFWFNMIVGTIVLVIACCTRQVGIFLAAGFAMAMIVRWLKKRTTFSRVLLAMLPGIVATATVFSLVARDRHAARIDRGDGGTTYVDQYRQPDTGLAGQLLDGVRRQIADVGRLTIPGMWGSFAHYGQWLNFNTILYSLYFIPMAVGWWRFTKQTIDPLLWTVPFYCAMFVLWPFDQGTRFNVPMLPVLWASVWIMLARWPKRRVLIMTIVLGAHLLASLGYLAHDTPIVARKNRLLPPAAKLAEKVTSREPAATLGLPANEAMIWKYLLDRKIIALRKQDLPLPQSTHWLLMSKGDPAPPGFGQVDTAGEYALWRRQ